MLEEDGGSGGGAEDTEKGGGTTRFLDTSCSFDLLESPVVAGSPCLANLQLSIV